MKLAEINAEITGEHLKLRPNYVTSKTTIKISFKSFMPLAIHITHTHRNS